MGEWKRIFHWKLILLIFGITVLNMILFSYQQLAGRSIPELKFSNSEYNHLIERYKGLDPVAALERLGKEQLAVGSYIHQLSKDVHNTTETPEAIAIDEGSQEMIEYYSGLTDREKNQMMVEMKHMRSKLTYLAGYQTNIHGVLDNAESLKHFSLFSNPKSFSYNNILKTAEDFQRVQDVTPTLTNDRAVEKLVNYYYIFYFAFAIMLIVIYNLFKERENGMWTMVHCAQEGRGLIAVKRLLLILSGSLIVTGILYVTTLITSLVLYGGWGDLNTSIQSIRSFQKFTYVMSKPQYLWNNFIMSWFAVFCLSVLLWMLFTVFRSRNHTLVFTGVFLGLEIFLFQEIQMHGVWNYLKYINIVNLFKMNEIYSTYQNWGFGTHVFNVFHTTMWAVFLLSIIVSIIAVMKTILMRPEAKTTLIHKVISFIHERYQSIFAHLPVTYKELHKLIITGKGVWVVAVVIIIAVYFSVTGIMTFSDTQKSYDKMYLEHGGRDYTFIQEYVENEKQYYMEAVDNLNAVSKQYSMGEVDLQTLVNAKNNVDYASNRLNNVKEYNEKIDYLNRIKVERDIDGYLISDRGYEQIFGEYSIQRELILIILLTTGIMLIISECISMEYRTGMETIVRSCERGRVWLFCRKAAACLIFTSLLFLIVYTIDYVKLYQIYGLPYLEAPIQSLTFMENCRLNGTVGQWIGLNLIIRYVTCFVIMSVAIIVSKIIGKKGNRALTILVLVALIFIIVIVYRIGGVF